MRKPRILIFDWGDTLMRDFPDYTGPMAYWPRVELMSGVAEAVEDLHRQFVCCVASNATDSDARLLGLALERGGVRQYFTHLFTSHELGYAKPDPEFFGEILRRLKAPATECVAIGNDYDKDICAAKAAGLRTIWIGADARVARPAADATAESMSGLGAALEGLGGLRDGQTAACLSAESGTRMSRLRRSPRKGGGGVRRRREDREAEDG